ncbi:MAG: hypothetical protein ACK5JT_22220 [Hyphomicrobiaceae bacterium]
MSITQIRAAAIALTFEPSAIVLARIVGDAGESAPRREAAAVALQNWALYRSCFPA